MTENCLVKHFLFFTRNKWVQRRRATKLPREKVHDRYPVRLQPMMPVSFWRAGPAQGRGDGGVRHSVDRSTFWSANLIVTNNIRRKETNANPYHVRSYYTRFGLLICERPASPLAFDTSSRGVYRLCFAYRDVNLTRVRATWAKG